MVDIQHKDITGADAAHPPFYASESDPTTTLGAYRGWFKPSTGEAWIRNATNTDWIDLASAGGGSVSAATEGAAGIAEIATQAETDTGTDDGRIVTPLKAATTFLAKAGGTLSGFLSLHADPSSAMHAVTKQYADSLVSGGSSPASETTAGIAELATQTETNTGTDDARIVTPLKLATRTATETRAGVVELATDAETQTGTDTARAITAANLSARSATETRSGIAEVATQAETNTGTDDAKMVTPAKFAGRTSTDTRAGVVELATDAETQTGTDTARAITPANLSARSATETRSGIAELATQAETDTGTDDGRIVTPLKAATRYLAKAGGTLTGFLTLNADPTSALHAVTKQYADGLVAGGASPASETVAGVAEIATQVETNAGTDDARIVTPLKLANYSGLGSGGSGNIAGAYDIEAGTYTDAGMSDEFEAGSLDAQWTIDPGTTTPAAGTIDPYSNPAAHVLDFTTRDKGMLVQPHAAVTEDMMRLRQTSGLAAGESVVVAVTMPYIGGSTVSDNYAIHIDFSNGSAWNGTTSNPMRGFFITGTSTIAIRAWNYNTNGALTAGSHTYDFNIYGRRMYFRISRVSNTYHYTYSFDGTGWNILASETLATHFTHFWLTTVNRQTGAGQFVVVPFHWVRHVASTGYDPW